MNKNNTIQLKNGNKIIFPNNKIIKICDTKKILLNKVFNKLIQHNYVMFNIFNFIGDINSLINSFSSINNHIRIILYDYFKKCNKLIIKSYNFNHIKNFFENINFIYYSKNNDAKNNGNKYFNIKIFEKYNNTLKKIIFSNNHNIKNKCYFDLSLDNQNINIGKLLILKNRGKILKNNEMNKYEQYFDLETINNFKFLSYIEVKYDYLINIFVKKKNGDIYLFNNND
jgi:hypothetical protein